MRNNPFTRHPKEVGEGYFDHLRHALKSGLRLTGSGLACIVHAFIPFLFVNTASDTVRTLHKGISKRVDTPNWERHPII